MRAHFLAIALLLLMRRANAAETYCNPLDLDYQYIFEEKWRNISYRSGADPVLINHQGEYYLFGTIANGFWHSKTLRDWKHFKPSGWPTNDMVAPAALSAKGKIWILPSTYDRRPIYVLSPGATPRLEVYNSELPYLPGAPGPWDPAFFYDEDTDEWYLFCGSSNLFPLWGVRLDEARHLNYVGAAREMIVLHPEDHGWERFGRDHRDTIKPFMEGAWMTKHGGRYYLQYAAPGTEYNVYANGTYIADRPLGPFTYAPNNPVSYKPGGFVTGAGHGNTFKDNYGNYWNTGTPWVAVNFDFERRIAMFPAGFDKEGLMFASTRFGDFPQRLPRAKWEKPEDLFAGWMLLSYRKPVSASSGRYPFGPAAATDEDPRTFWLAASGGAGEWLTVDLAHDCEVRAVQVNFTDYKSGLFGAGPDVYTEFILKHSSDGTNWAVLADLRQEKRRDRPNAYIELPEPVRTRFIRYEHLHTGSPHLAISDLRVFGQGPGEPPAIPASLEARRGEDERNAFLTWEDVPGAVGYNVRWGMARDKLYQTYQVWGDARPRLEIRALNVHQPCSFAIEAFNETGVSGLSQAVSLK